MRKWNRCCIAVGMLLATMLLVEHSFAGGDDGRIRLETELSGGGSEPAASGKAKFEKRADRVRLSIEVEDVLFTGSVEFFVNGVSVGTLDIVGGGADLNLRGGTVPDVSAGSTVTVQSATGEVILSGSF